MRYIETEMEEPTYNRFQVVAGSIIGAAAVVIAIGAVLSLISAL